jgi:hypothetical protein
MTPFGRPSTQPFDRLSAQLRVNPKLVPLLAVPLVAARTLHVDSPSLWLATALWLLAGVAVLVWVHFLRRTAMPIHGAVLVASGALCNGLVMLLNGGVMPVHGVTPAMDAGAWRSADHGGHLLFLADRMSLGGASPGDLLILSGLVFTFGVLVSRGGRAVVSRLVSAH